MRLGIDASNLRQGGGVTHLAEMLRAADAEGQGFEQVHVWGGQATLARIEERTWLVKSHQPALDKGLIRRMFWQRFELAALARAARCDALLVPGGANSCRFHPVVAMSRNMLPFEWQELARYGWSWIGLRLVLLRFVQTRTFRHSEGVIFLTRYARDTVMRVLRSVSGLTAIIPHGVDRRFFRAPRVQLAMDQYTAARPFRVVYVSIVDVYKHQWHVAAAVAQLREQGLPIALDLVGPAYAPALARLKETMRRFDPHGEFLRYAGPVPSTQIPERYAEADLCVYASSCENLPNILLEAMASGLPICCSKRGPMSEVLGDGGIYIDPEDPADISRSLHGLLLAPALRARLAERAYLRAQAFSWQSCARETLSFLAEVVRVYDGRRAIVERC